MSLKGIQKIALDSVLKGLTYKGDKTWYDHYNTLPCAYKGGLCPNTNEQYIHIDHNVYEIKLPGVTNKGKNYISSEIGKLIDLEYIYLGDNYLSKSIPTEIGYLKGLTYLNLGSNQLTKTIPTEIGNLSNIWFLNLSFNQLSKTIPTEIGIMNENPKAKRDYLDLSSNCLTITKASANAIKNSKIYSLDLDHNCISKGAYGLKGIVNRNCSYCGCYDSYDINTLNINNSNLKIGYTGICNS